jgi:hypothetical protein
VNTAELPEGLRGLTSADLEYEIAVWSLVGRIEELESERDELEAELDRARRSRGPVLGGPPREWDYWVMELPDKVFLDCLGPKESATLGRHTPAKAPATGTGWLQRNAGKAGAYAE